MPRPRTPAKKSDTAIAASRKTSQSIISRKKGISGSRNMKQVFKGKTMALSGDFGEKSPHEQIAKWITAHGGNFVNEVTDNTTHLICSIEDYKQKKPMAPQVEKALALGRRCEIVVYDWLVDCITPSNPKKRLRNEKPYTLNRTIQRLRKGEKDLPTYRRNFEDGVKASKELCDNKLYHVYVDSTHFEYKVILTRMNLGGRITSEKYTLFLFESHALPHLYMFGAKLSSKIGRSPRPTFYYRVDCHAMPFDQAFHCFKNFFREKTKILWDQRMDNLPQDDSAFKWFKPRPGAPVGNLPPGWTPPVETEEEEDKDSESDDVVYDTDSEDDGYSNGTGTHEGSSCRSSQTDLRDDD